MRQLRWVSFFVLSLGLGACSNGGDDGDRPGPNPGDEVVIAGQVTLPAGCTTPVTSVEVLGASGAGTVGADGAFRVTLPDDSGQFAVARIADKDGGPLLMGWLGAQRTTLSARSTAEVLVWMGLGSWTLPVQAQVELRSMIGSLGEELDALEAAVANELVSQPGGLNEPSPGIAAALASTCTALLDAGKGLLIEPYGEHSGVAVLNEGGLNAITLKNSYRRRVWVSVDRTAWVDEDDWSHDIDEPADTFELDPVGGFDGVIGTIGSYFTGEIAYTPVFTEPIELQAWPEAKHTLYTVVTGGMGVVPADGEDMLTQAQADAIEYTALKTVVWDFFLPLVLNIVATASELEVIDGMGLDAEMVGDVADMVEYCSGTIPDLYGHVAEGNAVDAVLDLYDAFTGTDEFQTIVFDLVRGMFTRLGVERGYIGEALDSAASFLNLVGWIDIAGGFLDSGAIATQIGLSEVADRWEIKVTAPRVSLMPEHPYVPMGARLDTLRVRVVDDTGGEPDGSAYAYHWRCPGQHGSLINPVNGQQDDEFQTSFATVSYQADINTEGVDSVFVDVFVTLGGQQEFVGSAVGAVEVFWGIGVDEYMDVAWGAHFNLSLMGMVLPYCLYFNWERDDQAISYDLVVYKGWGYDVPIEIIATDGDLFGQHNPDYAGHVVVEDSVFVSIAEYNEIGYEGLRAMIDPNLWRWWGLARPIYVPVP